MRKLDVVDSSLILSGFGISLVDIQNILSIIILVVDFIWILIRIIIKLRFSLKDSVLTEEEELEIQNEIDKLKGVSKNEKR